MASGTNYSQEYGQAEKAYLESDFAQAAEIINHLATEFPDNSNVLLLRGHIYCYGFQNYELARQEYERVLELNEEKDLVDFARSGIEQLEQLEQQAKNSNLSFDEGNFELTQVFSDGEDIEEAEDSIGIDFPDKELAAEFDDEDFDFGQDYTSQSHHKMDDSEIEEDLDNPFANGIEANAEDLDEIDPFADFDEDSFPISKDLVSVAEKSQSQVHTSSTFMVDSEDDDDDLPQYTEEDFAVSQNDYTHDYDDSSELEIDTVLTEGFSLSGGGNEDYRTEIDDIPESEGLDYQDELEFDEIDSSFFDLEELEQGLPDTGLFNVVEEPSNSSVSISNDLGEDSGIVNPDEMALSEASSTATTSFPSTKEELQVEVSHGALAGFINAPMPKKQLITAGVTGLVSAIAVLGIGVVGSTVILEKTDKELQENILGTLAVSLVAGVTSFGTAAAMGNITAKHITKASQDLQNQFDDVYQGNLNAKATVYAQDEFGQLSTGFNRMTRVILTTTQEAQRRAEETEQAKEDLQRQVIRLLDDVEGAARGDLTVQATVTADVLGAVADAFNLTIQSLREIVRQVKEAAEQVNKGSTDSELFARNQSSEALRMAEELAVTLNSVQMMTESIERVADNAREAEEVARSSSVTALKGGKAVERTVSGIFQIRETVSETARKVKRLAEASQEISKIVLLISQIAERTNQLALNASIQAAKAGEAGRGFAVVADEVRQLADRSGKSLKEIEQIVLQIQSETGSVMTAMEEGIQEVIDVTERAEQAKTALEDIIQVSNRIDTLVRSITADTVEQRENSRAVAQVMQSVELTAQATSQESQRVGGALQNLVGIARGLLSSVERFRIDKGAE
ncbi:HAMP domain-containing protein [Waterburya agarophytonicola K14]|uniref:HAMP domain-containing protein n=1 Tax=Waterburya agarophytonicola KI4 TaxID=2874699 RepID=A0A964FIC5_9CYAN|nr:HAMP domain-containing methyl-accepting chemotaxis protein [Waterburya agarophytonicola]MCC0178349.1 HAMP domain-containing protein [Waterburya agarophytonicola KI4]